MRQLSLTLSLAFFLAAPALSVAADDAKPNQPGSAVAVDRVACSLQPKAEEPSDPSSTSAIPRPEKFVARDHFKENIASSAPVKISWLGATFAQRFTNKVEDETGGASLQTYVLSAASRVGWPTSGAGCSSNPTATAARSRSAPSRMCFMFAISQASLVPSTCSGAASDGRSAQARSETSRDGRPERGSSLADSVVPSGVLRSWTASWRPATLPLDVF